MAQTTITPLLSWLLPLGAIGLVAYVFVTNRAAARQLPQLGGTAAFTAIQAGLPRSRGDDPALVRYARRTRRWRIGGALIAFAVMVAVATITEGHTALPLQAMIVGWFAGGLVLDLFARNRSRAGRPRGATDDPLGAAHVTPTARRWLIASFGLGAAAAALSIAAGQPPSLRRDGLALAATVLLAAVGRTRRRGGSPPARSPPGTSPTSQSDKGDQDRCARPPRSAWTALQVLPGGGVRLVPAPGWW